jgi:hypothetical protein
MIRLRAAQFHRRDEHQHVHDQVYLRGHRGEDPVRVRDARYEGIEQGDDGDDGALRGENAHLDALAVDPLKVGRKKAPFAPAAAGAFAPT